MTDKVTIGKADNRIVKIMNKPKNRFRILIRQMNSGSETLNSFMIYDYSGKKTAKSLKKEFMKSMRHFTSLCSRCMKHKEVDYFEGFGKDSNMKKHYLCKDCQKRIIENDLNGH